MTRIGLALLVGLTLAATPADALRYTASVVRCPCSGNAPDWSQDVRFKGVWSFEERRPSSIDSAVHIMDSSSSGNHIQGPTVGKSTTISTARERCRSLDAEVTGTCSLTDGCVDSDFHYGASWTMGCWVKPDDCGGACSNRRYMMTDPNFGNFGDGYHMGWVQTSAGMGKYYFDVDPGTSTEIRTAVDYTPGFWHHHIARFTSNGTIGVMEQIIDGITDSVTASGVTQPASWDAVFKLVDHLPGNTDACFTFSDSMSLEDICRIAVCGVTGCGCVCDGATYVHRPLHSSDGGPLTCSMPTACNKAAPD